MKKLFSVVLILLTIYMVGSIKPLEVHADMGPKASVTVEFENLNNDVYVTLLSSKEYFGPAHVYDEEYYGSIDEAWQIHKNIISKENFEKFINYEDVDGYLFLQQVWSITKDNNTLRWGYYPPGEFKILVLYPNEGKFASSDKQERYAFNSFFTVDMKDFSVANDQEVDPLPEIVKSYDYFGEIMGMVFRIILTLLVELTLAIFFFSKKSKIFKIIVIINVITQVILNVVLNIVYYYNGGLSYLLVYIPLELLVILIEALTYIIIFKSSKEEIAKPVFKAISYALIANIASFCLGIVLAMCLPFGF